MKKPSAAYAVIRCEKCGLRIAINLGHSKEGFLQLSTAVIDKAREKHDKKCSNKEMSIKFSIKQ